MIERDVAQRRDAQAVTVPAGRTLLDMNAYQWTVLFAAWLGWGFDIFDSLLFNYVAPNAVPVLLDIPLGTPAARAATLQWTGILTSLLLIGWAVGGIIFGRVADRLGRTRTLLLTMMMYAIGTAACAFAPNMATLVFFRIIASLGIGGEWAAGAAMVAEVVPEKRRVEAGALLYTAAPFGLFLATIVTYQVQGVYFAGSPETSWRYVFLFGLLPAAVAFCVRLFIKEPERWEKAASHAAPPRIAELFSPTVSCNHDQRAVDGGRRAHHMVELQRFHLGRGDGPRVGGRRWTPPVQATALVESWKQTAGNWFNIGGLIGTLLTVPASKYLGRRTMFAIYFLASGLSVLAAFGLPMEPRTRLFMYFPIGLSVFGVFGAFTYYLPELYPTRLRGTGAGFCYNAGRLIAAAGPFLVGAIASRGAGALGGALQVLFYVGFVPLLGLLVMPWVMETKGKVLAD